MIHKAILSTLAIFIFSSILFPSHFQSAQTPELSNPGGEHSRLYRLHYANSSGEKGISTFVYDADSKLIRSLWQLTDGSRSSMNTYSRDSAGRITEKHRVFSDGKTSDQVYTYNSGGFLIQESFRRSDGVSGTATYLRDETGRIRSVDCRGLNGWFVGRIDYSIDLNGRIFGARLTREEKPLGRITITRDEKGRLKSETWHIGSWNQTFTYEYRTFPCRAFTGSNPFLRENCDFRLVREEYDFNGKTAGPSTFQYNKTGRLVSKKFTRSDGLSTTTSYVYDPYGVLTHSFRRYSDGKTAEFSYRYNGKRRLMERIFKRSDGVTGKETYSWDTEGRLIGGQWDRFDSWLTGTLTFTHDRYGRLESGKFKGEKDLNAHITFSYNDNGNLNRIHWEFSSGHTQTYSFFYQPL